MVSIVKLSFFFVLALVSRVSRGQRMSAREEELPPPPPNYPSAVGAAGSFPRGPNEDYAPRQGGQFGQREERGYVMPPSPFDEGPSAPTNPTRFKEMIDNLRNRWRKIAAQIRRVTSSLRSIDVDGDTASRSGVPSPPSMPRGAGDEAIRSSNDGMEYSRRSPRN